MLTHFRSTSSPLLTEFGSSLMILEEDKHPHQTPNGGLVRRTMAEAGTQYPPNEGIKNKLMGKHVLFVKDEKMTCVVSWNGVAAL